MKTFFEEFDFLDLKINPNVYWKLTNKIEKKKCFSSIELDHSYLCKEKLKNKKMKPFRVFYYNFELFIWYICGGATVKEKTTDSFKLLKKFHETFLSELSKFYTSDF